MTSREREFEIFRQVSDVRGTAREALLRRLCGTDAAVYAEVSSLLHAHDAAGTFLREDAVPVDAGAGLDIAAGADADALAPGMSAGSFRVLRKVGAGGMGEVYAAERDIDGVRQVVALKLVRSGPSRGEFGRRFKRERRALARLEHANITRLIDVGATAGGVPFLAMEYVDGEPIDVYCRTKRLPLRDRLAIFLPICRAVQYAHQHLIVHRDIKPGNVLVSRDGTPKLLDFGIAQLLDDSGEVSDLTRRIGRVFTPRYASPEQLRGDRATTAADVYSLGVLLHELLTGSAPSDPAGRADGLMPSAAVIVPNPRHAGEEPVRREAARRALRGDLDAIVATATRLSPEDRYGSVQGLIDDVERHLDGRPVAARRQSIRYRVSKFCRRHRVSVAAVTGGLLALLAGAGAAWSGMLDARAAEAVARAERDAAVEAQADAEEVVRFFQEALEAANPVRQARDMTAVEIWDAAAEVVAERLGDRPRVEAAVRLALGHNYAGMWMWDRARSQLARATALYRALPEDRARLAECLSLYGRALTFARDPVAEAVQREGLDLRMALYGVRHEAVAESWGNLGFALWHAGGVPRWAEAERCYLKSLSLLASLDPSDARDRARFTFSLGVMYAARERYDEALPLFEEASAMYARRPDQWDRYAVECMLKHARTLMQVSRFTEARALLDRVERMSAPSMRRVRTWSFHWLYGHACAGEGDFVSAERMFRRALADRCRQVPRDCHAGVERLRHAAEGLTDAGAVGDGGDLVAAMSDLMACPRCCFGLGEPVLELASLLTSTGRAASARALLHAVPDVGAIGEVDVAPVDWRAARWRVRLACGLLDAGDTETARWLLDSHLPVLAAALGEDHALVAGARARLYSAMSNAAEGGIPFELTSRR